MNTRITAIIFFFLILLFTKTSFGQQPPLPLNDTIECMRVVGLATENNLPLDGVTVKLFKENEEMECAEISSVPKHDHHFTFDLLGNSYYTIQVSKEGYVSRSVAISTVVPPTFVIDENNPKTSWIFEVELFKLKKGTNDEYLDFPIAIASYNPKTKKFERRESYTTKLKSKLGNVAEPDKLGDSKPSKTK